jgi:uncharacterized protein (DUF849 family)
MLLKACLNGPRRRREHPALPITPAELAADAAAVVAEGAGALHLHPKDRTGADTLYPPIVAEVLGTVRTRVPGVPVGVTTGAWAVPDPMDRAATVAAWSEVPDFASVNWHEPGAEEVATVLIDRGVGVEAGLWTPSAVVAWLSWPLLDRCRRVLVELIDDRSELEALADADVLLTLLGDQPVPVLLHGEGTSAWPVLREGVRRGLDVRIGLEDTLVRPDGTRAEGNADLVRAARELMP